MSSEKPANLTARLATADIEPGLARGTHRRVFLLVAQRDRVITVPLSPGVSVVIGREPPADVPIPDRVLSRRHARFTLGTGDEVSVEDLGSMNGTWVGGERVERATVRPGEEVLLGSIAASLHVVAGSDTRPLGLDGHEGFRAALEAEIARARFLGRPLSVLMVRALHDGARPGERLVTWAPRAREILRPIDRIALYGADVIELLLPETDRDRALGHARALTVPGKGAPLVCGVACFPGAASAEELIEAGFEAVRRATAREPVQAAEGAGHRTLAASESAGDAMIMESAAMRAVAREAAKLASVVIPVLIHGETGTGKEVLARLIHEGGPRRGKPLVAVNCAAIAASLLEGTLFGHVKGAFTHADQDRKGLFEEAHGGTLLLDEVGELPPAAQAALLRVLETKKVRRVGASREIDVDVRVLAATHRDLEAMAEAGTFRSDLLYRLNTMDLTLPPLRERRADIAPLAQRFREAAGKANGRAVRAFAPEAMALLESHAWPGNVRELRNAVERAVVVAEGDTVTPLDLPARIRAQATPPSAPTPAAAPRYTGSFKARMERFERDTLIEVLRETNGNQTRAAELLEMPLRTLQHRIKVLAIGRRVDHGQDA